MKQPLHVPAGGSETASRARKGSPPSAIAQKRRIFFLEAKYEFLKLLRLPAFSVPTLLFPVVFYLFFGIAFGQQNAGPVSMAAYLLATYGAFGVIGAALFSFGVGVAVERGQGWLLLKRASPMPPAAYFFAKIFLSMMFGGIIVASIYALGSTFGKVQLSALQWLTLALVHISGAVPFAAFGLALGYWSGPNSAPAVANLVYLPMAFLSGLWIPLAGLPQLVQELAPFLPAYHYSQLALKVIGASLGEPITVHLLYLVSFTVFCLLMARIGYVRDEDKTYG